MASEQAMTERERLREAYIEGWLRAHSLGCRFKHPLGRAMLDWRDREVTQERPSEGDETNLSGPANFMDAVADCSRCGHSLEFVGTNPASLQCVNPKCEPSTTEGEREKALAFKISALLVAFKKGTELFPTIDAILALLTQPQEPGGWIEPRPEIQRFAEWMELRLRENDHKQHWTNLSAFSLLPKLKAEVVELVAATDPHHPGGNCHEEITREAADVANYAMMIADIHGTEAPPPEPAGDDDG